MLETASSSAASSASAVRPRRTEFSAPSCWGRSTRRSGPSSDRRAKMFRRNWFGTIRPMVFSSNKEKYYSVTHLFYFCLIGDSIDYFIALWSTLGIVKKDAFMGCESIVRTVQLFLFDFLRQITQVEARSL